MKVVDIKIISKRENPLLKRIEVYFQLEHSETGSTPPRSEARRAIAGALKTDVELVFVKRFETNTGTSTAVGLANVYDSGEQARLIESEYIIERNVPPEKPEEEKEE